MGSDTAKQTRDKTRELKTNDRTAPLYKAEHTRARDGRRHEVEEEKIDPRFGKQLAS
jgi:hypothetical protein